MKFSEKYPPRWAHRSDIRRLPPPEALPGAAPSIMKPVVLGLYILTATIAGWCFLTNQQRVRLEAQRTQLVRTQRETAQKVAEYEASIKSLEDAQVFRQENEQMLAKTLTTAPLWHGIAVSIPSHASILRMEAKAVSVSDKPGLNVRLQLGARTDEAPIDASEIRAGLESKGLTVTSLVPQVSENFVTLSFTVSKPAGAQP